MKKVLFITSIRAPYRVLFFEELGKYCELEIVFEQTEENCKHRDKKWFLYDTENYSVVPVNRIILFGKLLICSNICRIIRQGKYDEIIIGCYSSPTSMAAIAYMRYKHIPFWLNSDGGFIKPDEKKIKKLIKTFFISSAAKYLASGEHTKSYLEYYGARSKDMIKYPFTTCERKDIHEPSVNSEKSLLRDKLGIKEKKLVISVGQFIYRKGFDLLISAAPQIGTDIGIYIIGGEPTQEYISQRQTCRADNVHFVEFKSKEELKEYYRAADLFVFPTREDIWGLVVVEALSMGLPVITTDKCGAGLELIKNDYNGRIVPVDDIDGFISAIRYILHDKDKLADMQRNATLSASDYTIGKELEVHRKALQL